MKKKELSQFTSPKRPILIAFLGPLTKKAKQGCTCKDPVMSPIGPYLEQGRENASHM